MKNWFDWRRLCNYIVYEYYHAGKHQLANVSIINKLITFDLSQGKIINLLIVQLIYAAVQTGSL